MIRLTLILAFFFLLVVGVDYYVQNIASPVAYRSGVPTDETNEPVVTRPEPPESRPAPARPKPVVPAPEDVVEAQPTPAPVRKCLTKRSEIEFYDYNKVKQKIVFEICDSSLRESIAFRQSLVSKNPPRDYVEFDAKYIEPILESYRTEIRSKKLDRAGAAEFVVASIQNIPYTLVHDHSHEAVQNPQTFIDLGAPAGQANKLSQKFKELHQNIGSLHPLAQPGGCLENIDYGMVTPIEMYINKMGDCDSRSTALYLVLKKLGYDVIMLGSDVHQHALLGLNLPGANYGNVFYTYRGKKYYIWETTAFHPEHTRLGVHSEGTLYMSNWAEWEVSLN
ncbi:MAG: hypothetical protein R2824_02455 [Saprospiraceae bacterium]|nr:hypothetical protein [Lewinella sp.]